MVLQRYAWWCAALVAGLAACDSGSGATADAVSGADAVVGDSTAKLDSQTADSTGKDATTSADGTPSGDANTDAAPTKAILTARSLQYDADLHEIGRAHV